MPAIIPPLFLFSPALIHRITGSLTLQGSFARMDLVMPPQSARAAARNPKLSFCCVMEGQFAISAGSSSRLENEEAGRCSPYGWHTYGLAP